MCPALTPIENEQRRLAYEDTDTDKEAAESLGISRSAFFQWRTARGLPNKGVLARQAFVHERDRARRILWEFGWNDADIAHWDGTASSSVKGWRDRNNLAANVHVVGPIDYDEAIEALDTSFGDREAATRLGISHDAFWRWRNLQGLPAPHNYEKFHTLCIRDRNQRRWDAYCREVNAENASARAGIPKSAMTRWIRREGLPPYTNYRQVRRKILEEHKNGDMIARRAAIMHGWVAP